MLIWFPTCSRVLVTRAATASSASSCFALQKAEAAPGPRGALAPGSDLVLLLQMSGFLSQLYIYSLTLANA